MSEMIVEVEPIHAAVGILKQNDQVLIAKRPAHKPYSGYWEFPGGKIEFNETSEDALKREWFEEINIRILKANFLFEQLHAYPEKTVLLEVWEVLHFEGELCPQENQELAWVKASDLSAFQLLDGCLPIIKKIFPHS